MSTTTDDRTGSVQERQPEPRPSPPPGELRPARPPSPSRHARLAVSFWWAVGSLVLMVVGAFGPWATVLDNTINGTDDSKDGWFVLGAAVVAALLLVGYVVRRRPWYAIVAMLAGLASAATAAYDIVDTNNIASQTGNGLVRTEWGIYLSLVASISLGLASLGVLIEARRKQRAGSV